MRELNFFTGLIRVEITSADPTHLLHRLSCAQIALYDVASTSDITVEITFRRKQLAQAKKILKIEDAHIKIKNTRGLYWQGKKILARPIFLSIFVLLILLTFYLPGRILFFEVEGNNILPDQLILEKAAACGIRFGITRKAVRSEKMKNALLAAIPELEWAGINTNGCIATISVKEKIPTSENQENFSCVKNIVASRDGVILFCSVSKGNLLCKPGQAVKAGQTLVSGYTDCGIKIQATQAEAEIFAQTYRTLQTVSLTSSTKRGVCTGRKTKYSLLVGKKLINFYKDSGIYDATCAKIYEQNYITLPGGFTLPVALITETWTYYETEAVACKADEFSWTHYAAEEYLLDQMVAGEIVSTDTSMQITGDLCLLQGHYICVEMIGQIKNEETIDEYGDYYGENR